MSTFDAEYKSILVYLNLLEKNTEMYCKMVREELELMKHQYEQRIQSINNGNVDDTKPENWKP